jgi:hypothetical protein
MLASLDGLPNDGEVSGVLSASSYRVLSELRQISR